MRTEVDDGHVSVMSCSGGDMLKSARIVRDGVTAWSAVALGDGLGLAEPITLEDVVASDLYDLSGDLVRLAQGDRVVLNSKRDSRVVETSDREQLNDELRC